MEYELKKIAEAGTERYMLLNTTGGMYQVSALLYHILLEYKEGKNYSDIAIVMNAMYNTTSFDTDFIEKTVDTALATAQEPTAQTGGFEQYVAGRITVIRAGAMPWLFRSLSAALFQRVMFPLLMVISVVVSFYFFYNSDLLSFANLWSRSVNHLSAGNMILVYVLFMVICLWHELGHAAASWRFGIQPREIGFGWYFIFPVFYANVSDIWQLPAQKRNVVNIAGIYFQLLVNVILIACYYAHFHQPLLCTLIISNTISLVCSLIPFFRYDGYWLFSDYFRISNLRAKAASCVSGLLFSGIGKWRQVKGSLPLVLLFYSMANVLFWIFVYAEVVVMVVANTRALLAHLQEGGWLYFSITLPGVLSAISTVIAIWGLAVHVIHLSKLPEYEQRKISGGEKPADRWHVA